MQNTEKIQQLLNDNPVMLFMKGSPAAPQCGFSARVVQILQSLQVPFHFFDVLTDISVRQGIKEYRQWPTIPQLYIRGELIGGCDIVEEQFKNQELQKLLQDFLPAKPSIKG